MSKIDWNEPLECDLGRVVKIDDYRLGQRVMLQMP